MVSGLLFSTLITLIFVPTLYAIFHRRSGANGAANGNGKV